MGVGSAVRKADETMRASIAVIRFVASGPLLVGLVACGGATAPAHDAHDADEAVAPAEPKPPPPPAEASEHAAPAPASKAPAPAAHSSAPTLEGSASAQGDDPW